MKQEPFLLNSCRECLDEENGTVQAFKRYENRCLINLQNVTRFHMADKGTFSSELSILRLQFLIHTLILTFRHDLFFYQQTDDSAVYDMFLM